MFGMSLVSWLAVSTALITASVMLGVASVWEPRALGPAVVSAVAASAMWLEYRAELRNRRLRQRLDESTEPASVRNLR